MLTGRGDSIFLCTFEILVVSSLERKLLAIKYVTTYVVQTGRVGSRTAPVTQPPPLLCHTGPTGRRPSAAKATGRVGGVRNIINLIGHIFSIKSVHLGLKLKLSLWQVYKYKRFFCVSIMGGTIASNRRDEEVFTTVVAVCWGTRPS